jgi:hypothetical protein
LLYLYLNIMIEVFKTDVAGPADAALLVQLLENYFKGYKVNFDLEDCDHILRVDSPSGQPDIVGIKRLLAESGFSAEVLQDDIESAAGTSFYTYQHPKNQFAFLHNGKE